MLISIICNKFARHATWDELALGNGWVVDKNSTSGSEYDLPTRGQFWSAIFPKWHASCTYISHVNNSRDLAKASKKGGPPSLLRQVLRDLV